MQQNTLQHTATHCNTLQNSPTSHMTKETWVLLNRCVAALLGKFEYMAYMQSQSAKFTYCADPLDTNQVRLYWVCGLGLRV